MNYIKQLETQAARNEREARTLVAGLQDLIQYLAGEKFHQDSTVQVRDVMARLAQVLSDATDVRMAVDA